MKSSLWYLPYLKHVTPWVHVLHKYGSSVCPQALNTLTESNVDNNCNGVPGGMWIWSLFVLRWVSSNLAHLIIWVCFNAREGQLTRVSHTLWPNAETFRESLYCTVCLGDSDSQECSVRKRVSEQCRRNSKRGQKGACTPQFLSPYHLRVNVCEGGRFKSLRSSSVSSRDHLDLSTDLCAPRGNCLP